MQGSLVTNFVLGDPLKVVKDIGRRDLAKNNRFPLTKILRCLKNGIFFGVVIFAACFETRTAQTINDVWCEDRYDSHMSIERHLKDIRTAIDFIEAHLTAPMSVQDVCKTNDISPWQFQRLFRLYTTTSIGEYIRARRLTEAAAKISAQPALRLLDIAIEFQFGSQEAFTRAFKRQFGVTPGEAPAKKGHLRLSQKSQLSEKQLDHFLTGVQKEPRFLDSLARTFVGEEILISSPFSEDESYMQDVSKLWLRFNPRRAEISDRVRGVGFGLVLSPSGSMIEDQFPYVASVEVSANVSASIPVKMKKIELPPQRYAIFEKRGLADKTRMSMDYIYGFWLPQSGFRRATGYDIEIYDHRLRLDQEDSVSLYCLPVQPSAP